MRKTVLQVLKSSVQCQISFMQEQFLRDLSTIQQIHIKFLARFLLPLLLVFYIVPYAEHDGKIYSITSNGSSL